ncbi:MAG TPA: hypothetical protein VH482_22805 [Thermomicrobiales bacterium]|jgi:hypothetical protein
MINEADAALLHHNDLLVTAARARLVAAANQPSPSTTPRTTGRFRASLRHAAVLPRDHGLLTETAVIALLFALIAIG